MYDNYIMSFLIDGSAAPISSDVDIAKAILAVADSKRWINKDDVPACFESEDGGRIFEYTAQAAKAMHPMRAISLCFHDEQHARLSTNQLKELKGIIRYAKQQAEPKVQLPADFPIKILEISDKGAYAITDGTMVAWVRSATGKAIEQGTITPATTEALAKSKYTLDRWNELGAEGRQAKRDERATREHVIVTLRNAQQRAEDGGGYPASDKQVDYLFSLIMKNGGSCTSFLDIALTSQMASAAIGELK